MTLNDEERELIQSILDDPSKVRKLGEAICWKETPEGYDWWLKEYRKDKLSRKAAKILRGYLRERA